MKKKAFTLAEVLMALCIVGIISALTVPNLSRMTTDSKIGPSLAKFVADFNNATGIYLQDADSYTLSDAGASNRNLSWLQNHMNLVPAGSSADGNVVYLLPNGSTVAIVFESSQYGAQPPFKGEFAQIVYDIDGKQGKNTVGRDIFQFFLDESGILVPYGSKASEFLMPGISTECETYNAACTGVIADNNYTTKGIPAYGKYTQKTSENNKTNTISGKDTNGKIQPNIDINFKDANSTIQSDTARNFLNEFNNKQIERQLEDKITR